MIGQTPSGYEEIKPEDLKNSPLFLLNGQLSFLWGKIGSLFSKGAVRLNADLTVSSIAIPSQATKPKDANQAITLKTADGLYLTKTVADGLYAVLGATGLEVLSSAALTPLIIGLLYQDIPGATITLTKAGVWVIVGIFDLTMGAGDILLTGQLMGDGVAQLGNAVSADLRSTVTQVWVYTASATGQIVKLQVKKDANISSSAALSPNTTITAIWIHS